MEIFAFAGATFTVLGLFSWVACAFFSAHIGGEKGSWSIWWFLMGLIFGPIGLLAAVGLPDKNLTKLIPNPKTHVICPDCAEFVRNEAKVCKHCGCKLTPAT